MERALIDLACPDGRAGALQDCVGIERTPTGASRLAGWQWNGAAWRRTWTTPTGAYQALIRWDIDGYGERDVLALGAAPR